MCPPKAGLPLASQDVCQAHLSRLNCAVGTGGTPANPERGSPPLLPAGSSVQDVWLLRVCFTHSLPENVCFHCPRGSGLQGWHLLTFMELLAVPCCLVFDVLGAQHPLPTSAVTCVDSAFLPVVWPLHSTSCGWSAESFFMCLFPSTWLGVCSSVFTVILLSDLCY